MSDTTKTADLARTIASIALRFGKVTRATLDHEGEPETDTTHTVMLQLLVIETLPVGRSLKAALAFALVHDLPEFADGDVCTARELTPAVRAMKESSERAAIEQLRERGLANCVALIEKYERRDCWEAGFVYVIDKCAPKLTHLLNGGQALRALDMSVEEMVEKHVRQGAELRAKYPEQVEALALFDALCDACERELAGALEEGGLPGSLDIDDGYPSEDAVAAISRYRGDITTARAWLRDTLPTLWSTIPCAAVSESTVDRYGRPMRRLEFVTGGWSGAESVIDAVTGSMLLRLYYVEWRRGGLHVFEVPEELHHCEAGCAS